MARSLQMAWRSTIREAGAIERGDERGKVVGMRGQTGFSLVELLVVVLILGALASIAVPRYTQAGTSARVQACNANVDMINSQIESYHGEIGDWPPSINQVVRNTDCFPDGEPQCPFGTSYKYDKDTHRVTRHSH